MDELVLLSLQAQLLSACQDSYSKTILIFILITFRRSYAGLGDFL